VDPAREDCLLLREVRFQLSKDRLATRGLPPRGPDRISSCAVLKLEFLSPPRQLLGTGYVVI
jgi:hypothetical protein